MGKKTLVAVLMLVLTIILVIFTLLYFKTIQSEVSLGNPTVSQPVLIEQQPIKIGDPARMYVATDQTQVEYQVDGEFDAKPTVFGDFISADFIIAGDQSRQPIRLLLGPSSSTILTGRDQSDSSGQKIVWSKLSTREFTEIVPVRQPVTVYFLYYPDEQNDNREINKYKQLWTDVNTARK